MIIAPLELLSWLSATLALPTQMSVAQRWEGRLEPGKSLGGCFGAGLCVSRPTLHPTSLAPLPRLLFPGQLPASTTAFVLLLLLAQAGRRNLLAPSPRKALKWPQLRFEWLLPASQRASPAGHGPPCLYSTAPLPAWALRRGDALFLFSLGREEEDGHSLTRVYLAGEFILPFLLFL